MNLPTRVVQAVRPQASPGVMAGAAAVAATFTATPFLLPDIAGRLSVDIGDTGLLSSAQVGSFAVASFLAGRVLRPRRRLHYGALILVGLATLASALSPTFELLLATRVVAGLGLGALSWIAWADATRFTRGIGDVAAIAPLTAAIASPPLGWLAEVGGYPWVYTALAVLTLGSAVLPVDFGELPRIGRRVSKSRSNRLLLAALLVMSLGGSSVFVFSGAAGIEVHGMTTTSLSWALSLNAVTGVLATRFTAPSRTGGLWLVGTATAALCLGLVGSPLIFYAAMALWGFAFWMGVPVVFGMLAAKSNSPSERVGDAQAAMATGRIFGPLVGGLALGLGQFGGLSIVGAAIIALAGVSIALVERNRARNPVHGPQS